MLHHKSLATYIAWMEEMIQRIELYTKDMTYEQFVHDTKTVDAVITPLIQIGENAGNMSKFYPDVLQLPYSGIVWMRNILVHMYHKIDVKSIRYVLQNDIPRLKELITQHKCNNKSA